MYYVYHILYVYIWTLLYTDGEWKLCKTSEQVEYD